MTEDEWMICNGVETCPLKACMGHHNIHRKRADCELLCHNESTCRPATDAEVVMHVMVEEGGHDG